MSVVSGITPKQKEFLRKFADLISEYDVKITPMGDYEDGRLRLHCDGRIVMVNRFTHTPSIVNDIRGSV